MLQLQKAEVEKWLNEWDIDVEERAAFCKSIADALVKSGQPCVLGHSPCSPSSH